MKLAQAVMQKFEPAYHEIYKQMMTHSKQTTKQAASNHQPTIRQQIHQPLAGQFLFQNQSRQQHHY